MEKKEEQEVKDWIREFFKPSVFVGAFAFFLVIGGLRLFFVRKLLDAENNFIYIAVTLGFAALGVFLLFRAKPEEGWFGGDYYKKIFHEDLMFFRLWRKEPLIFSPFIACLVLLFIFILFEFKTFFALSTFIVLFVVPFELPPILNYSIIFFTFGFVVFSIICTTYLTIGEILQRKLSKAKNNFFIEIIADYVKALPFIITLSIFWVIFILVSAYKEPKRKPDIMLRVVENIKKNALKLFSYALFTAVKYYVYLALASIAISDSSLKSSIYDAWNIFKEKRFRLIMIWIRSGAVFGIVFVLFLFGSFASGLPIPTVAPIIAAFFLLYLLSSMMIEQISILLVFVSLKYPKEAKKLGVDKI